MNKQTITLASLTEKLGAFEGARTLERNQMVIRFQHGEIFQSYETVCGARIFGSPLMLSSAHDYSKTTSKWCREWCGKDLKDRRRGLENGSYIEIILN